ncbi:MAG: molybdenum cofactor guanylyltransferase [Candidatus Cloacimonetes bacterium]|nr:molybdenum cofactor guanylyltransferase [Candidatus Cloacimonadota bacterium]
MNNQIIGVILAGGKSARLKQDKVLLPLNGETLIERTFNTLSGIFHSIIIVSGNQDIQSVISDSVIVEDIYPGCGPLGGLHTALHNANGQAVFIVACDMPWLDADVICAMLNQWRKTMPDVLIPRHAEGIEPLHAIYGPACLSVIAAQIESGDNAIRSFFGRVNTEYWDTTDSNCFTNINTPEDLEKFNRSTE